MKPSGRLLHRRQGVRRSERDLVSILIAEGSLSSDWLVKCGDDRSVVCNLPQASELPLDPESLDDSGTIVAVTSGSRAA